MNVKDRILVDGSGIQVHGFILTYAPVSLMCLNLKSSQKNSLRLLTIDHPSCSNFWRIPCCSCVKKLALFCKICKIWVTGRGLLQITVERKLLALSVQPITWGNQYLACTFCSSTLFPANIPRTIEFANASGSAGFFSRACSRPDSASG